MGTRWISIGAISALLAIALGAFGAHALQSKLSERELAIFHTAAQYQMAHALALVMIGVWSVSREKPGGIDFVGASFVIGTLLFSGSLYALALSGIRALGAITPLGGISFMVGWASLAWVAWSG